MDAKPGLTRGEATRLVMNQMKHSSFTRHLSALAEDGSKPVVVALDDDRLSEVVGRVEASGGAANVIVAQQKGFYVMVLERATQAPGAAFHSPTPGATPIHQDINMQMMVSFMESNGGTSGMFSIAMGGLRASVPRSERVVAAS